MKRYPSREIKPEIRTTEDTVRYAEQAHRTGEMIKGIKGISALLGMDWFDLTYGIVPDYMHGLIIGIFGRLLELWFAAKHSREKFSIRSKMKEVDERLMNIKPTDDVGRLPRTLFKYSKYKASEKQNMLLFYILSCLKGILPDEYLDHLALFIDSVYVILGDQISEKDLGKAEKNMKEFYNKFGDLYHPNFVTLNLHNAGEHMVEYVRINGPAWGWSCFGFEDMNGNVLEYAHGTGKTCYFSIY